MPCVITCSGIPIGEASVTPFAGLAHASLEPLPAYESVRFNAVTAGARLRDRQHWPATAGDFAEEFARAWDGGRLAVTDVHGTEVAVASVIVLENAAGRVAVVIDARPDMARVEALLRTIGRGGDDRSRPAA